jgi:hypothetical protein
LPVCRLSPGDPSFTKAAPGSKPNSAAAEIYPPVTDSKHFRRNDRTLQLPSQLPDTEGSDSEDDAERQQQKDFSAHLHYIAEVNGYSGEGDRSEVTPHARMGVELLQVPAAPPLTESTSVSSIATTAGIGGEDGGDASQSGKMTDAALAAIIDSTASLDPVQRLYHLEARHWAGVTVNAATGAPLQVPSTLATAPRSKPGSAGVVTVARLFPQSATRYASALLCGLCNGRLAVYTVRWTGQPVELIAASAALDKADQAPIVDIKAATFGSNMVVSRTQRGVILVHHMNWALSGETTTGLAPSTRKPTSWFPFSLFARKAAKRTVQEVPLLFRIDPADALFVQPGLLDALHMHDTHGSHDAGSMDGVAVQDGAARRTTGKAGTSDNSTGNRWFGGPTGPSLTAAEEAQLQFTDVCFHPSLTALGTNTAVMAATAGGDIVKFNMDHLLPTVASPVVYPSPPFVGKEFIHPLNAPTGFVLTAGVADRSGNKVFRELFHYHRHRVLLLEPIQRLSPYMLSLDQTGLLAVWRYAPQNLEGKGWFAPHSTTKLLLRATDIIPVAQVEGTSQSAAVEDTHNAGAAASAMAAETPGGPPPGTIAAPSVQNPKNGPPSEDVLLELKVREVFADAEKQRTYKWYEPAYCEARQAWVRFRSVEYDAPVVPEPAPAPEVIVDSAGHAVPALHNRLKVNKKGPSGATTAAVIDTGASGSVQSGTGTSTPLREKVEVAALSEDVGQATASAESTPRATPPKSHPPGDTAAIAGRRGSSAKSQHEVGVAVPTTAPLPAGGVPQPTPTGERENGAARAAEHGSSKEASPLSSKLPERVNARSTREHSIPELVTDHDAASAALTAVPTTPPAAATAAVVPVVSVEIDLASAFGADLEHGGTAEVVMLEPDSPSTSEHPISDLLPAEHVAPTTHTVDTTTPTANSSRHSSRQSSKNKAASGSVQSDLGREGSPAEEATGPVAIIWPATPPNREQFSATAAPPALDTPEFPETVFTQRLKALLESSLQSSSSRLGTASSHRSGRSRVTSTAAPPPVGNPPSGGGTSSQLVPAVSQQEALAIAPAMRRVVEWSDGEVLVERDLCFTILSAKMSSDGTELVLLLACKLKDGAGISETRQTPGVATTPSSLAGALTVYHLVPYLALEGRFPKHFPRLCLPSETDAVLDFCVGPVAQETQTRVAFVLTRHAVRVFSLHTGREIITNTVPFVWDLTSFAPTMLGLCASQRVLTLAAVDDARVAVFLLQHSEDGSTEKTADQEVREQALRQKLVARVRESSGPRHVDTHALLTAVPLQEHAVRTVLNLIIPSAPLHQAAVSDVQDIVDALMDHVCRCIDLVHAREGKAGFIKELFDGNMGYIAPTSWPPTVDSFPPLQLSQHDEEGTAPGAGASGDALSPNSVSRERGRHRRDGKRKRRRQAQPEGDGDLLVGDAALDSLL